MPTPPTLADLPPPPPGRTGWPWTEAPAPLPLTRADGAPWPRISIVTPSYNQGQYIEETIRSVLLQGYPNLEYIVIDGGSTDESVEIIRKYEPWLSYWVSERDNGQGDAINKGFERSSGEIIGWLNSDDLFHPDTLRHVAEAWRGRAECHFLTGDGEFVNAAATARESYLPGAPYRFEELLAYHAGKYLPQPAVFFSREAYRAVGGLDTRLHFTMDLDLWLRLRKRFPLHYLPTCLAMLRHHDDAKTWRDNVKAMREVRHTVTAHARGISLWQRFRISWGLRSLVANALVGFGLGSYLRGDRRGAREGIIRAVTLQPLILFRRGTAALLVRLIFPMALKRRVLRAP